MRSAVSLRGVSFGYQPGRYVLRDVDFEVETGGYTAVIGPNGGGKSTLLKIMLGLLEPWTGTVEVLGLPPARARHRIGYVPQASGAVLDFPVSALDVVMMGLPGGRSTKRARSAALSTMERLGIAGLSGMHAGSLSGGQRQRAFIARALVGSPEILLLDEPAASVDPEGQESFYELMAELNRTVTIVMVTHDVGAVSNHVKTIACLSTVMVSHGESLETEAVARAYGCSVDLVSHGTPHRVLGKHEGRGGND
ncbi:metal ABC transporter ATP-binding protein [Candidatus Fermentibacteria bacterium]|nr:metal ABC transporter ATP-binding protein [Candidatus Fermentibacteria bacterium]